MSCPSLDQHAAERSTGVSAARRMILAFACIYSVFTAVGCIGPGLEPPWEDHDKANSTNSAGLPGSNPVMGVTPPPTGAPTGDFGNSTHTPMTGTVQPPAVTPATPATGGAPGAMDPGAPPSASMGSAGQAGSAAAGSGAPTMGAAGDAGMPTGSQGNDFGVDFLPDCPDETSFALPPGTGSCSYPLPEGVDIPTGAARIALLSAAGFTTIDRVDGPVACGLLTGGFFFDSLSMPTRITLCPQSCLTAGNTSDRQVVLVLGCAP